MNYTTFVTNRNPSGTIEFTTNISNTITQVGSVANNGTFTIGPSGFSGTHVLNGNLSVSGTISPSGHIGPSVFAGNSTPLLGINYNSSTITSAASSSIFYISANGATPTLVIERTNSATGSFSLSASSSGFQIKGNSSTNVGLTIADAGGLTIGPSGFGGTHTVNGNLTTTGNLVATGTINPSNNGILGFSGGAVNPIGTIGEMQTDNASAYSITGSASTFTNLVSLPLTSGTWVVFGTIVCTRQSGQTGFIGAISTSSASGGTEGINQQSFDFGTITGQAWNLHTMMLTYGGNVNSGFTFYLTAKGIGGTGTYGGSLRAFRIG